MTHSGGKVWCVGGFDGQKTLGDTLCIDVQQLGKLKATSHSTKPETFAQPEQASPERRSRKKADGHSQDASGEANSARDQLGRMSETRSHALDDPTSQPLAAEGSSQGIATEEKTATGGGELEIYPKSNGLRKAASPAEAGLGDKSEATAIDTAALQELIVEMKSGQISKKQSVDLDSKHIACSIAQGAPLSPRLQTRGEDMELPDHIKPPLSNAALANTASAGPTKSAIRMLTAGFKEAEGI